MQTLPFLLHHWSILVFSFTFESFIVNTGGNKKQLYKAASCDLEAPGAIKHRFPFISFQALAICNAQITIC